MKSRNSINDHNVDADEKHSFPSSDRSISVVVVGRDLWFEARYLLAQVVSLQWDGNEKDIMWFPQRRGELFVWILESHKFTVSSTRWQSSSCRSAWKLTQKFSPINFTSAQVYQLDSQYAFTNAPTSLLIRLGDKSRLIVKQGFFGTRNYLNSFVVEGQNNTFELSKNSVDMESFALRNIGGQFPEIKFVSLNTVVLHEKSLDANRSLEIYLTVESVWNLLVKREVFGITSYNALFNDIGDLRMDDGVLKSDNYNLTRPKIIINQSSIKDLLPMRGPMLTELKITNSLIESISKF